MQTFTFKFLVVLLRTLFSKRYSCSLKLSKWLRAGNKIRPHFSFSQTKPVRYMPHLIHSPSKPRLSQELSAHQGLVLKKYQRHYFVVERRNEWWHDLCWFFWPLHSCLLGLFAIDSFAFCFKIRPRGWEGFSVSVHLFHIHRSWSQVYSALRYVVGSYP